MGKLKCRFSLTKREFEEEIEATACGRFTEKSLTTVHTALCDLLLLIF